MSRPLVYVNMSDDPAWIWVVTIFSMVCIFITMIWCFVHFSTPPGPDHRTWQQKYMDNAYHQCEMVTSDVEKLKDCYLTVYGAPQKEVSQ